MQKRGLRENAFIAKMGSCENALLLRKELIQLIINPYIFTIDPKYKIYLNVITQLHLGSAVNSYWHPV